MDRKTLFAARALERRLEEAEGRLIYAERETAEILPGDWYAVILPETQAKVRELVLADLRAERDRIAAEFAAL